MQKVLITGGTGFLGSYLCERFVNDGYEVATFIRPTSNIWRISAIQEKIRIYNLGEDSIGEIVDDFQPDHIVHTVCDYGRTNSSLKRIIQTNIGFGIDLLEASLKNKVQTFVNTDTLLPSNINDYSLSKHQFKNWLKAKSDSIDVINLRVEMMYGPRDDENKFIYWLIQQIKDDTVLSVPLTSGIQKRDFIYITDVVDAFLLTLENKKTGFQSFDVGTGDFIQVKDFVNQIITILNRDGEVYNLDKIKFGEINYRSNELMAPKLNNTTLRELGWIPKYDYKIGLNKMFE